MLWLVILKLTELTTVLDEKKGNTLVGWGRVSEEKIKSTRESKANTVTVTFLFLICLTRIFANTNSELEYKSSLVTWMPDDSIFALEHKNMIQKIWVENKKELIHWNFWSAKFCSTHTHVFMKLWYLIDSYLHYFMTSQKIFKMLWHWFSRLKKKNFTDIIQIPQ